MKALPWIISVVLAVSIIYMATQLSKTTEKIEVTKLTKIDTVVHTQVQLVDSFIIKYKTVYLPINERGGLADSVGLDNLKKDSLGNIKVDIPISQKVYKDSLYKVWVSGYEANLDSIEVYNKIEKEVVTHTIKRKDKRWALGPQIGVGLCGNKLQPYVGIGLTYNIW